MGMAGLFKNPQYWKFLAQFVLGSTIFIIALASQKGSQDNPLAAILQGIVFLGSIPFAGYIIYRIWGFMREIRDDETIKHISKFIPLWNNSYGREGFAMMIVMMPIIVLTFVGDSTMTSGLVTITPIFCFLINF